MNVELPRQQDLDALAPDKDLVQIGRSMRLIRDGIDEAREEHATARVRTPPSFSPAGQATQMIVGATSATDRDILATASSLYTTERLRRVYYSAFSPIPDASADLPPASPPLLREHRLYQADWLMRYYGYSANELTNEASPDLELAIDPKLAWALQHRGDFPLDLNAAPRELLLRVPGVGVRSVDRIIAARRHRRIRFDDLVRLRVSRERAMPFVVVDDYRPDPRSIDAHNLRDVLRARSQLDLFSPAESASNGEL
jgi:predicted DNA-binding helix-hairpin-helix protein